MKLIDKRIGIIGYGYVGKAMERFFADHYYLKIYDPIYIAENQLDGVVEEHNGQHIEFTTNKDNINSCDLVVVCVPTPQGEDNRVDLSIINETFEWLNAPLILIKSTIPPGTTDELVAGKVGKWIDRRIAFSPEYIGEGGYVTQWWKDKNYPHATDMKYHDFQIFGGKRETTSAIIPFFQRVIGPEPKYAQTDARTAELVKYMVNAWGATKVTFVNEFYNIAKSFGVDYNELRELWLLDGRAERMHTAVFPEMRGFGGKCFPKDVNGIVKLAEDGGYDATLLKEVLKTNDKMRELNPKPH